MLTKWIVGAVVSLAVVLVVLFVLGVQLAVFGVSQNAPASYGGGES